MVVLGIDVLLLVSVLLSASLTALGTSVKDLFAWSAAALRIVDFLLTFSVAALLFAMIFNLLPNVILRWRDVGPGACLTAFLFTVGKFLIGFYLGTTGVATYYGAAGSAAVLLLWVYYSACILFFGAEFTKVYVEQYGGGIKPDRRAIFRSKAAPTVKSH